MKKALLALLAVAIVAFPVPGEMRSNSFPNHALQHAMLRLEDVGPGSSYATPDDLGKLRAVFEYLHGANIPFQVACIPRSIQIAADGTRYEKGIDDPQPDETTKQFIQLLQNAQAQGAVIGMHGYTHQYGTTARGDGNQNTGVGSEFNVPDAPETATQEYAAERITKSLAAFAKNGLVPGFWESPHYSDTREQQELFRSYVGILHQPDMRSLSAFLDLNVYESPNDFGGRTLGSVYVPAPLKWVHEGNTVDDILDKLTTYKGLGSMFYHPFLEFDALEPDVDAAGQPLVRDGLPVYRYKEGVTSDLHRLVAGVQAEGYRFVSLYDVVPFTPAHRVELPLGTTPANVLIGDVSGNGQEHVVWRDGQRVDVFTGSFAWPRNRVQNTAQEWLQHRFAPEDLVLLGDTTGDGRQDLLVYNQAQGTVTTFPSNGVAFDGAVPLGTLPPIYQQAISGDFNGDKRADLLLRNGVDVAVALFNPGTNTYHPPQTLLMLPEENTLRTGDLDGDGRDDVISYAPLGPELQLYHYTEIGTLQHEGSVHVPQPRSGAHLLVGDTNGDQRHDVIIHDAANGLWQVFESVHDPAHGRFTIRPLANLYGPWARGERLGFAGDFDGNGRTDIAAYDEGSHLLDVSLSFRHHK